MSNVFLQEAYELKEELVRWRRALHQNPEVGTQLPRTVAYIQQRLEAMVDPGPLSLPAKAAVERGVAELANWLAEVIAEGRSTRCVGDAPDVKLMREMTACLRELDGLTRTDADGGTRIEVVFGENVTGCCG